MDKLKAFLKTTEAKRAGWTLLNTLMALTVSLIAFLASENVAIAITILPFAQAVSQWFTKFVNKTYL
jgi:heme/copper-type cytochrome/quinol oxidase subunit 4